MKKLVIFNGTPEGIEVNENLVTAVYERNKDVKFGFLREGQATLVEEEIYESISNLSLKDYIDDVSGYVGGDILLQGDSKVRESQASTPFDIEAIVNHNLNTTQYYVLISDPNYEIKNKNSKSFTIKLKNNSVGSKDAVRYIILSN